MHPSHQVIKEVQGLRAIAVLSVLVYHVWPEILPGGYVGVDVFFVISGFLITGSLFKEFKAEGRIDILRFYARRIRRLLPAATVVSVAVALSIPLFPKGQWPDIVSGIVASAAYVQNWFLAAQAVDYLAGDTKGPMNHFWSLSVEEQYYIIWPLILFPMLVAARKAGVEARKAFGWIFTAVGAGSLAYSVYLTPLDPGTAYFATTTRAWELALGGALAVFLAPGRVSDPLRAVLGLVGILGIVAASLAFDENTQFPGYAALLPTLAAAAVITSSGAQEAWSGRILLNSRPFQYLGDISYSLYLWHWPLIVVYAEVTERNPGLAAGALILFASCGLAHVSKVFVEDRFRSGLIPIGRTIATGAACVAATLALGAGYLVASGQEPGQVASGTDRPGIRAMIDPRYDWRNEDLANFIPRPEHVKADVPSIYKTKCHQDQRKTEVLTCTYGNRAARMKIVMIGDSHAGHFYPAFEELARKGSIQFHGLSKSACLFSLEAFYHPPFKRLYTECLEWSKNVIAWLERERPDLVLIAQSPAYPETVLKGMAEAWSRLTAMGLDVRAIRSTPWLKFDADKCLATSGNRSVDCAPTRDDVFRKDPVLTTARELKRPVLDLTKYLCDSERCPTVIGGILVYRDRHHLTATFARTLSHAFRSELSLDVRLD
ncbi:acyltransferase family protein [Microvirga mediterraneensis]|uniref:Acyltransferase n=1 Tax=Microvirga mediterraneensis TaxID=2754695 RepID=A0A838BTH1_9HYPH|nr:acyltransferase family protein [Microvirga mediterraneensis]MBA1158245.1 acyltransferase [Microvirga mediterraneensis]